MGESYVASSASSFRSPGVARNIGKLGKVQGYSTHSRRLTSSFSLWSGHIIGIKEIECGVPLEFIGLDAPTQMTRVMSA